MYTKIIFDFERIRSDAPKIEPRVNRFFTLNCDRLEFHNAHLLEVETKSIRIRQADSGNNFSVLSFPSRQICYSLTSSFLRGVLDKSGILSELLEVFAVARHNYAIRQYLETMNGNHITLGFANNFNYLNPQVLENGESEEPDFYLVIGENTFLIDQEIQLAQRIKQCLIKRK